MIIMTHKLCDTYSTESRTALPSCTRPYATSVSGLELLVYTAFSY